MIFKLWCAHSWNSPSPRMLLLSSTHMTVFVESFGHTLSQIVPYLGVPIGDGLWGVWSFLLHLNQSGLIWSHCGSSLCMKRQWSVWLIFNRDRFEAICRGEVKVPGLTIMKDVSIISSEYVTGEKAINKIQELYNDPVLFEYCNLPEVRCMLSYMPTHRNIASQIWWRIVLYLFDGVS